jgi:hypothetical protein
MKNRESKKKRRDGSEMEAETPSATLQISEIRWMHLLKVSLLMQRKRSRYRSLTKASIFLKPLLKVLLEEYDMLPWRERKQ